MLINGHETKPVKCLAFVYNGLQQMPNASKQKQKTVRLPGFPLFFQGSIQGSSSFLGFVYPLDPQCHQKFQVPKMQVLNLNKAILEVRKLPYISRIHTAYIGFCTCKIRYLSEMFGDPVSAKKILWDLRFEGTNLKVFCSQQQLWMTIIIDVLNRRQFFLHN